MLEHPSYICNRKSLLILGRDIFFTYTPMIKYVTKRDGRKVEFKVIQGI